MSGRPKFSAMQWMVLGLLGLLVCGVTVGVAALVLQQQGAAPAAAVVPTAASGGPSATPILYPTLPPEWTATPVMPPTATALHLAPPSTAEFATEQPPAPDGSGAYAPVTLSDLCANPARYKGQKVMVRGQVTRWDHYTDPSTGPYTQVQVGDFYASGSACLRPNFVAPVVVLYNGTLPALDAGTAVVVEGTGTGVIPDPSQLSWVLADSINQDPSCDVTLTVHANPGFYIVLDRVRQRPAVTGAQFTGVCSGPHELTHTTLAGPSGAMSINIPEGVTAWNVNYGTAR
jgi:hypothetical protein